MSYDTCEDLALYLEGLGFGEYRRDIWTGVNFDMKGQLRGILIEENAASPTPDVLINTTEQTVDITICKGYGDLGRTQTIDLAHRVYKALDLVLDTDINGSHYIAIIAENAPYEIRRQKGREIEYFNTFRVTVTKYYDEDRVIL